MLVLIFGLFKGMRADMAQYEAGNGRPHGAPSFAPEPSWQSRLALALHTPKASDVADFIGNTARPALEAVAAELSSSRPRCVGL